MTENEKKHLKIKSAVNNYSENPRKKDEFSKNKFYKDNSVDVSIVIPLLNEEESLVELSSNIKESMRNINISNYEVIFIDDGSTDNSIDVIRDIHSKDSRFHCIRFRRNFGKSAGLSVGFMRAKGKYVVTMDADLQDDPAEIPNLLKKLDEGYDLVSGWKKQRYDPINKTLPSKLFNAVTSITSGIKLHDFNCGLKAYKSDVIKTLHIYGEMHRYIPALAHWEGFKVTEIPVQHHRRKYGKSKFGVSRFINGFLDLLTVLFTTKYMKRPLHFFGLGGTVFLILGLIVDLILSIQWIMGQKNLSNRPLLWFGIALIVVGVQFISLGLIAELITKHYMEIKKDQYSIAEKF